MQATPTFDEFDSNPRDRRGRLMGDERLHVTFYEKAVENVLESEKQGRKIFEPHTFIRILVPGDQYCNIDTFATEAYYYRFPGEYERFKAKQAGSVAGTPIDHMPGITVAQVAEFKAMNIQSVEDLADLADATASRIMGGHELKRKATNFLETTKETAIATRAAETAEQLRALELQNLEKDAQLAAQAQQVATLQEQMAVLMAATTKKANKAAEA